MGSRNGTRRTFIPLSAREVFLARIWKLRLLTCGLGYRGVESYIYFDDKLSFTHER
jgi:hypothetical protein